MVQRVADHVGDALGGLDGDIADETVADDNIGPALVDLVGLDKADIFDRRALGELLAGFAHGTGALVEFGADVEQAEAGWRAVEAFGEHRTHDGEFKQVLRLAFGIGADIEQQALADCAGNGGGHGRFVDAGYGFEQMPPRHEQGAGIAGADHGLAIAAFNEFGGDEHRAFPGGAQRRFGALFIADGEIGVEDLQFFPLGLEQRGEQGLDALAVADEHEFKVRAAPQDVDGGGNGGVHPAVATHGVDGDAPRGIQSASVSTTLRPL